MMVRSTWLSRLRSVVRSFSRDVVEEVRLEPGTIWAIPSRFGESIVLCEEGKIWITEEGESTDLILDSGQGCRLGQNGLRLVQAVVRSKFIACALPHRRASFTRSDPGEWLRPRQERA